MLRSKFSSSRIALFLLLLGTVVTLLSSFAVAQEEVSQAEIFGGYSYEHPGGRVPLAPPSNTSGICDAEDPCLRVRDNSEGWAGAVDWNFNKWMAMEIAYDHHYGPTDKAGSINQGLAMGGLRISSRHDRLTPWGHLMVGAVRTSITNFNGAVDPNFCGKNGGCRSYGFSAAVGGGLDFWFREHFGFRIAEVDYVFQNQRVGNFVDSVGSPVDELDLSLPFKGYRIESGILIGLGHLKPPIPPSAACFMQPVRMLAGEPATANVDARNFDPKHSLKYDWNTTGGAVTPRGASADINTAGLAAGSYTVTATVTDVKLKTSNTATCSVSFEIQEPPKHPPTICCSGNQTVHPGETATITCQASSPDNRPLKFDWAASAGRITAAGATGTLDTTGAPVGPINVTTTVSDDRGLSATGTTVVTVESPQGAGGPGAGAQVAPIGEIAFPNKRKAARVDNTDKAILDDVALRLQREADAKVVVVGYFDSSEPNGTEIAKQRAVNTKAYLVDEKGIDPARIEVRTGTAGGTRAEVFMVPPGATFNVSGTETFDASTVKKSPAAGRHGRHGAGAGTGATPRRRHKKAAGGEGTPPPPATPEATPAPQP